MSIKIRLGILYACVLALVLIVLGMALYYSLYFTLNADVNRTIEEAAQTVADSARPRVYPELGLVVNHFLDLDVFASPPIYVQAIDGRGTVKRTSSNLGETTLPYLPEAIEAALQGQTVWTDVQTQEAHLRILSTPLRLGGIIIGVLQVGTSLNNVDHALRQLLIILGLGGIISSVLSAALGFFLADRALAPIDRITQTALEITRTEDLSRRIQQVGPQDEMGRLATTFNEMLERIEQLFHTQQRFIADVSHELRTPLTVIRGNVDILSRVMAARKQQPVLADGPTQEPYEEAFAESLSAIERESERMARLINDLLLLAQADAGVPIRQELVEMDELLLGVYRHGQALSKDVVVELDNLEPGIVAGDPDRLEQLLLNLLDNAIKYTPAGGQVTLGLKREDGWVRIDIADTGVGIPAEDLPHIFERFYRVDKARSRQNGGTGLGLSIARWIVEAHNGYIDVESEINRGTTFTVWLPEATVDEQ